MYLMIIRTQLFFFFCRVCAVVLPWKWGQLAVQTKGRRKEIFWFFQFLSFSLHWRSIWNRKQTETLGSVLLLWMLHISTSFLEGCNRRVCSEYAVLNLIATPLLSKRKGNMDVGMEPTSCKALFVSKWSINGYLNYLILVSAYFNWTCQSILKYVRINVHTEWGAVRLTGSIPMTVIALLLSASQHFLAPTRNRPLRALNCPQGPDLLLADHG